MAQLPVISYTVAKFMLSYYNRIDGRFVRFLNNIPKQAEQRFYDSYSFEDFKSLSEEQIEDLLFSIVLVNSRDVEGNQIKEYYSFEEDEIEGYSAINNGQLKYPIKEVEFLKNLYGEVEPQLQIELSVAPQTFNTSQQSVDTNQFSYNSLSSMGGITQESISVSSATGSANQLITTTTETISDVGGLSTAGRNRAIESERVTVAGASDVETVRTSGY